MDNLFFTPTHLDDIERPIISEEEIMNVLFMGIKSLKPVERYLSKTISIDSEIVMSVKYSQILKKEQLHNVIEYFSSLEEGYSNADLKFLLLRTMIIFTWKLNMQYFFHFNECSKAVNDYNSKLLIMAHTDGKIQWENNMPYWLRHIQLGLEDILQDDVKAKLGKIEFVISKVNGISAQCKKIGNTYIIAMDVALYFYLQEWNRLLLFGYRMTEFCAKYNIPVTNVVKTGDRFIFGVVEAIYYGQSIVQNLLPMPLIPVLSENDSLIIKNMIGFQMNFIIGHEIGHIMLHNTSEKGCTNTNEIEADLFSVDILKDKEYSAGSFYAGTFGDNTHFKSTLEKNDVQPDNNSEAFLQSVNLLFSFMELVEYYRKWMCHDEDDIKLIGIQKRKEELKNRYMPYKNDFDAYVEQLICVIKEQLKGEVNQHDM